MNNSTTPLHTTHNPPRLDTPNPVEGTESTPPPKPEPDTKGGISIKGNNHVVHIHQTRHHEDNSKRDEDNSGRDESDTTISLNVAMWVGLLVVVAGGGVALALRLSGALTWP